MDPLSPTDKVLAVLRQRLRELNRPTGVRKQNARLDGPTALARLKTIASEDVLSEAQLRRKIIQDLLADQLGEGVVNEASFQAVVDRVTEALSENREGAQLLDRVITDLRARV